MRAFAIRSRIKPPHMGLMSQFVIVLLVVALMGAMAIEPVRQLLDQRELVNGMQNDLRDVELSNDNLRARIKRLNDPDFIEQIARGQIGLVREGEIPFVVMPSGKANKARLKKKHAAKRAEAKKLEKAAAPAPATEDPGFVEGVLDFVGL